jgi:hypothetical protein
VKPESENIKRLIELSPPKKRGFLFSIARMDEVFFCEMAYIHISQTRITDEQKCILYVY